MVINNSNRNKKYKRLVTLDQDPETKTPAISYLFSTSTNTGLGLSRCLGPGECLHSFILILGWHSGDAGVCLWAVHGATELRVFTVVAFCAAWNGGGAL